MTHVLLKPDGFYVINSDCRSELFDLKDSKKITENYFPYLRLHVLIDPQTTIGDIFQTVKQNIPLKEFISGYTHCKGVDAHLAELDDPIIESDIQAEFFWHTDFFDGTSNFCEIGAGLYGWQVNEENDLVRVELNNLPLNQLAPLKIKLDYDVEIRDPMYEYKLLFKCLKSFTLLDILEAMFWEISWWGMPPEKYTALNFNLE